MHYEKEEYVGNTSTQIHSRVWAFKIFKLFSYMICEKVDRTFMEMEIDYLVSILWSLILLIHVALSAHIILIRSQIC